MRRKVWIPVIVLTAVAIAGSVALASWGVEAQSNQPVPESSTAISNQQVAELVEMEAPVDKEVVNEVNEDPLAELHPKPDIEYPNLGYDLDQKVSQQESGNSESMSEGGNDADATDTEALASDTRTTIPVIIHLTGNVDGVVAFLEDNGGDPRNIGDDYIEAYVPVSLLGELSEQTGVFRVREMIPAHTR